MLVKSTLFGETGPVTFEAELSKEEFDFVFNYGLNTLLKQGAIDPRHIKPVEQSVQLEMPLNA